DPAAANPAGTRTARRGGGLDGAGARATAAGTAACAARPGAGGPGRRAARAAAGGAPRERRGALPTRREGWAALTGRARHPGPRAAAASAGDGVLKRAEDPHGLDDPDLVAVVEPAYQLTQIRDGSPV